MVHHLSISSRASRNKDVHHLSIPQELRETKTTFDGRHLSAMYFSGKPGKTESVYNEPSIAK